MLGVGATKGAATTDEVKLAVTSSPTTISVVSWYNRNGAGGSSLGRIYDKQTGANPDTLVQFDASAVLWNFRARWTNTALWTFGGGTGTGAAHHFGVSYDGSSTANLPVGYIDGVSQSVSTTTAPSGTRTTNTDAYTIGNRDSDKARVWDGLIGEFAIFDVILTAAQFAALAKGASPLAIGKKPILYLPLVRSVFDVNNSGTITTTGTAVQPHVPGMMRPAGRRLWVPVNSSSNGNASGSCTTATASAATGAATGDATASGSASTATASSATGAAAGGATAAGAAATATSSSSTASATGTATATGAIATATSTTPAAAAAGDATATGASSTASSSSSSATGSGTSTTSGSMTTATASPSTGSAAAGASASGSAATATISSSAGAATGSAVATGGGTTASTSPATYVSAVIVPAQLIGIVRAGGTLSAGSVRAAASLTARVRAA